MKKLLYLFVALSLTLSCSKEEEPNGPTTITGGEAFRGQVMQITIPNGGLSDNEYPATFNGEQVTVLKTSDDKLVFGIAPGAPLGVQQLVIPSLNATVNYEVKEVVLPGTPEETVQGFTNNFQTFLSMVEGSPEAAEAEAALNSFTAVFEHSDAEGKRQIAACYFANKVMFDEILLSDYDNMMGRGITVDDILEINKHLLSVIVMTGGSFIVYYGVGGEKVVGAVCVVAGAIKARKYFMNVATKTLYSLGVELDGAEGDNNRTAPPTFENGVARTVNFTTKDRKFITADASNTNAPASKFFDAYNKYNWTAGKVNTAIAWINNNIPFADFGLITLEQLPASSTAINVGITQSSFNNFVFRINHPNLTLTDASFVSEGRISITVQITGNPTSMPVDANLEYTYTDQLTTFSGRVAIQVIEEDPYESVIIGTQTWMVENADVVTYRNGDPIPQVESQAAWEGLTTGAWCNYAGGKLYNWYAITDSRGFGPEGWHVPTAEEYELLLSYLGGAFDSAPKLRATWGWSTNAASTNSTGFSALPTGYRYLTIPEYSIVGGFAGSTNEANLWASSEFQGTGAYLEILNGDPGQCFMRGHNKRFGCGVRLIKD